MTGADGPGRRRNRGRNRASPGGRSRPAPTGRKADAAAADYRYVDTAEGLDEVVAALSGQSRYALDTEFHREHSYWPDPALIQIAWADRIALIDPLAVDPGPLARVIGGDAVMVAHAADQDLEVLHRATGAAPSRIFDTQIAARFLGPDTPSLAALCERELGRQLPKANRLTDWLERPLRRSQLDYAAADVACLLEIADGQAARLGQRGRRAWAEDEFDALLRRSREPRRPEEAWTRIKEARRLRGQARSVARSLAAWRERRAAETNRPVRHVLSDMAVVTIAEAAPRSTEEMAGLRGVDAGLARGRLGSQILDAVGEGIELDWRPPPQPRPARLGRDLKPAVGLVAAWMQQTARDLSIDPTMLATRADIEALMGGDADARLDRGWRADLVGEPIRRLVAGDAALAFEDGAVVFEERSRRPVEPPRPPARPGA